VPTVLIVAYKTMYLNEIGQGATSQLNMKNTGAFEKWISGWFGF